jgi:hypothetical protein
MGCRFSARQGWSDEMVGSDRPESKTLRKEFLLIDRNIRPAAGGAIKKQKKIIRKEN